MKVAVCIKQVPVVSMLKFDNESRRVVREGVPSEVNPFDVLALSLAVQLKESDSAEVAVYTMGPPQARDALVQALAMGADRAVHLNDRAFAGSDTLATARALALALQRESFDLIICGLNSVDAETGQVGPEVAEMMGIPQVTGVRHLQLSGGFMTARRITDEGYDIVECPLPALITVTEEVAPEIYPNREAREAAKAKPIVELTAADLAEDTSVFGLEGSPTSVSEIYTIEPNRDKIVSGDKPVEESVAELVAYLEKRGVFDGDRTGNEQAGVARGPRRGVGNMGAMWVVADIIAGRVRPVTLELLGRASELASQMGTCVEAVLIGGGVDEYCATLTAHGADRVHLADAPVLERYDTDLYTSVLSDAIKERQPYAVLFSATMRGRDLAARVAGRLKLGLTGDCIGLEIDDEGRMVQLKPAFGGNIVAPILSTTRPYMATVRPGMHTPVIKDDNIEPVISKLPTGALGQPRVKILESVTDESLEGVELDNARVIVAVGKGVGGPENLGPIRELAALFDAPLGATRDVTELGWLPRQIQIGLSGKSVSPDLYFAIALRGAFNHTVGIQKAGTIVAINNVGRSPIFQAADFGIIGDYKKVLPVLVEALKNRMRWAAHL
ncbi:MAG: electron transfer flavoprotein alpha/ beta subunit [Chloroflexi bacterium]|nr:electron transfer flavoprotein alpha/ beta subunit [Chloroflexota bacterium]